MPLFLTQDDQDHSQKMRCTQLANGEGPSSWARWLCASHLQTWKVATGVMICRQVLLPEFMQSMSDGTVKHFRFTSYGTWIMCSSVKAVRPTFRSLSLAESSKRQAQRGTGFQLLNFQDLSKRLTSSYKGSRPIFSPSLGRWTIELLISSWVSKAHETAVCSWKALVDADSCAFKFLQWCNTQRSKKTGFKKKTLQNRPKNITGKEAKRGHAQRRRGASQRKHRFQRSSPISSAQNLINWRWSCSLRARS